MSFCIKVLSIVLKMPVLLGGFLVWASLSASLWAVGGEGSDHEEERVAPHGGAASAAVMAVSSRSAQAPQPFSLFDLPAEVLLTYLLPYLNMPARNNFRLTCRTARHLVDTYRATLPRQICWVLPAESLPRLRVSQHLCITQIPSDYWHRRGFVGLMPDCLSHLDLSQVYSTWPALLDFVRQLRAADKLPATLTLGFDNLHLPVAAESTEDTPYDKELPSAAELEALGVALAGVQVRFAFSNFHEWFLPPLLNALAPTQMTELNLGEVSFQEPLVAALKHQTHVQHLRFFKLVLTR